MTRKLLYTYKGKPQLIVRRLFNISPIFIPQEIGWFDQPENQPGALTAKLASEASKLRLVSGSQIGNILEAVVSVIASWVIAFVYSWQLTLLFLVFYPLIVLTGVAQVSDKNQLKGYFLVRTDVVQFQEETERSLTTPGRAVCFPSGYSSNAFLANEASPRVADNNSRTDLFKNAKLIHVWLI